MKEQKRSLGAQRLTLCVLVLVLVVSILNVRRLAGPAKRLLLGEVDFETFVDQVQNNYLSDLRGKEWFINLNGLFARATGRQISNEVIRLQNGMLVGRMEVNQDPYPILENLVEFQAFLAERDIPFLFVQSPYKMDEAGELLPKNLAHCGNYDADLLQGLLAISGVRSYDLRPEFSFTAEMVEKNFFRTDHHWKFETALRAFPLILEQMDEAMPNQTIDKIYAEFDQWDAHTLEDWFLGSQGKRVGVFYGGVDDVTYYTPRFETQISCAAPGNGLFYQGDFVEANIREECIQQRDYFNDSAYNIYVGNSYALTQFRNAAAPNRMKVLVISDSFMIPIAAFFSTVFQEVDVLDVRFSDNYINVAGSVCGFNPDIVVMMINPEGIGHEGYADFNVEQTTALEAGLTSSQICLEKGNIAIDGTQVDDAETAYGVLETQLEYGKKYTLCFEDVKVLEGSVKGLLAQVREVDENLCVASNGFDLAYCRETGRYEWVFYTPPVPEEGGGQLELRLYAGMPGETEAAAEVRLVCSNVSLLEEK